MAVRDSISIETTFNHDLKKLKKLMDPISDIRLEVRNTEAGNTIEKS
jgi:hypothetical protein